MLAKQKAAAKLTARDQAIRGQQASVDLAKLSKPIEMYVHMIDEEDKENNRTCCITDVEQLKKETGVPRESPD